MPVTRMQQIMAAHNALITAINTNDDAKVNEILAEQLKFIKANSWAVSKAFPYRDQVFVNLLNLKDKENRSLIALAAEKKNLEIIKALLKFSYNSGQSVLDQGNLLVAATAAAKEKDWDLVLNILNKNFKNTTTNTKSAEIRSALLSILQDSIVEPPNTQIITSVLAKFNTKNADAFSLQSVLDQGDLLVVATAAAKVKDWDLVLKILNKNFKNTTKNTKDAEIRSALLSILQESIVEQPNTQITMSVLAKFNLKFADAFSPEDHNKIYLALERTNRIGLTDHSIKTIREPLVKFVEGIGSDILWSKSEKFYKAPNELLLQAAEEGDVTWVAFLLKHKTPEKSFLLAAIDLLEGRGGKATQKNNKANIQQKKVVLNLLKKYAQDRMWVQPAQYEDPWLSAFIISIKEGDVNTVNQLLGLPTSNNSNKAQTIHMADTTQKKQIDKELLDLNTEAHKAKVDNVRELMISLFHKLSPDDPRPVAIMKSSTKPEPRLEKKDQAFVTSTSTKDLERKLETGKRVISDAILKDPELKLFSNSIQLAAGAGHLMIVEALLENFTKGSSFDNNRPFYAAILGALKIAASEGHQDVTSTLWDFITQNFSKPKQFEMIMDIMSDVNLKKNQDVINGLENLWGKKTFRM